MQIIISTIGREKWHAACSGCTSYPDETASPSSLRWASMRPHGWTRVGYITKSTKAQQMNHEESILRHAFCFMLHAQGESTGRSIQTSSILRVRWQCECLRRSASLAVNWRSIGLRRTRIPSAATLAI
ncbi:hypothetical protein POX_b03152 [Penicillium oxalicum]|uniref:Uncharacterized protein n=1 Tax=Penicillium oxalicum (strain 114-2 / CGMCC 5302) TaxID=933388 RepID=S7ZHV1_PENO1|nr:hypothetical protein POX_b03152 [Penicillium oxalicum]EPS29824.1 hypothetical protein PDE_04774 [Penicillium oxalicum 114-2]KAI2793104.1 hypothetical protein POX_b03152 [Penicillium oxalicum]